jgi:hypothetical protein
LKSAKRKLRVIASRSACHCQCGRAVNAASRAALSSLLTIRLIPVRLSFPPLASAGRLWQVSGHGNL